ncbi:MAG: type IX secretion system membrane protein PorP/SprF [Flavobacteriaceae bacterium]|nr:type IX secretion system membrane protein PorP/SprF [Flavobacteriaceae bacterium]
MIKKINIILLLVTVMMIHKVNAQQKSQYTQYMYNMNVLNPAYSGTSGALEIVLLGRTQWVGIDGFPKTFTASANMALPKRVGLGISILADKIGPVNEQNLDMDVSYKFPVTDESMLSFGIKVGATFFQMDREAIILENPEDSSYIMTNTTTPNFGFGMLYYTKKYYIGISIPNILESERLYDNHSINGRLHTFLTAGYIFGISDDWKLKPSFMMKATQYAPISLDISLNVLFKKFLELGISLRNDNAISMLVGTKVSQNIRIGCAYDYTFSDFTDNNGSYEIMFLFTFPNKRNNTEITSPVF